MRRVILLAAAIGLASCDEVAIPEQRGRDIALNSVTGMEGCILRRVRVPNPEMNLSETLSVVRCPNSATATTYRVGKTSHTTVTVDGGQVRP